MRSGNRRQAPSPKISEKTRPEARQRRVGRIFDIFAADFCYRTARGRSTRGSNVGLNANFGLWRRAEGSIVAVMGA